MLRGISDKLADLNATRFHDWQPSFYADNARRAILAFKGDVYTGLLRGNVQRRGLYLAQQHLRMLPGLYGVLRPLDLHAALSLRWRYPPRESARQRSYHLGRYHYRYQRSF